MIRKIKNMKLNTFHLKILAAVIMLIDHIACYLIPYNTIIYLVMRMIGRIAAPLFWFCFVEGYSKTSNRGKYAIRLAIAATIMSLGNNILLLFGGPSLQISPIYPNMFFTLLLMAGIISSIDAIKTRKKLSAKFGFVLCAIALSAIVMIAAEYWAYALFSILIIYLIKNKIVRYVLFAVVNLTLCLLDADIIQMFMVLSIIPLLFYTNEKPKRNLKEFFYVFYPAHTWILMAISLMIK